jgi:hypothetical protein
MRGRRWDIRWAWVPAAILVTVGSWIRFGPLVPIVLVLAGFGLAAAIVWRESNRP